MVSPLNECFGAIFAAKGRNAGTAFSDDMISNEFRAKDHPTERYVSHSAEGEQEHFVLSRSLDKTLDQAAKIFEQYTGLNVQHSAQFFQQPASIFGEAYTKPVLDAMAQARELHRTSGIDKAQFDQMLKGPLKQAQAKIDSLPQQLRYRAQLWLDDMAKGETIFGEAKSRSPIEIVTGNALGNLFTNNPAVALYNVFEYLPKATAWAIQNTDDPAGVLMRSMSRFVNDATAAGGLHKRIPSLEAIGVYGDAPTGPVSSRFFKKFGIGDVMDLTENPLRGLAYYLGEESSIGGAKALEDIAFVYRPGNEPEFMRGRTNRAATALMRFSVGSMQMYGGLAKRVMQGDRKAAAALLAFHVLTAAQTGAASTIPKPIYLALPDDMKENLKEMSGLSGLLGLDLAESTQPFGGVAFGLGYNIATNDLKALAKIPGGISDGIQDGDWGKAAYEGSLGVLMAGQLGRIPMVNNSTLRMFKVATRAWADNEAHLGYMSEELMKEYKLLAE